MIKISMLTVLLFAVTFQLNAAPYFGLRGGISETRLVSKQADVRESETDEMISPFIGYRIEILRVEAEYTYHSEGQYTKPAFDHKSHSFMGNMYLDPMSKSIMHPYINAGAGVTIHQFDAISGSSDNVSAFTWSVGAGFGLELSHNFFMDFGYRFLNMGKPKFEQISYTSKASEAYVGLRFQF